MDLYRYFHPHHNPRLRKTPVRLVELGELEQAAIELKKAVKRAEVRTANAPIGRIEPDHLSDIIAALDYAARALSGLVNAHPGDDLNTMFELLHERERSPGWENWTRLLKQRLQIICMYDMKEYVRSAPRPST